MKRIFFIFLVVVAIISFLLVIAFYVPLPLPPNLDFQVLYQADRGILHGVPLYDRDGQAQSLANEWGVSAERVFVLSFPYPPWYALATLPLALLPITVAARMWFLLNVCMLLISVWLLSDSWRPHKRLWAFVVAPLFLPILGALYVGQYIFPTLLGVSLLIYALRKQNIALVALGMALATFKPHIGFLILLAVFIYLLLRRDEFGKRAVAATGFAGFVLFAVGFAADSNWLVAYLRSLLAFRGASECDRLCVSFSLALTHLFGLKFSASAWIAATLLIALIGLFVWSKRQPAPEELIASFVCIALLVNPYLLNYDFSFLLIPMFILADTLDAKKWIGLAFAFLLPWLALGIFARAGNFSLLVSAILLFGLTLTSSRLTIKK